MGPAAPPQVGRVEPGRPAETGCSASVYAGNTPDSAPRCGDHSAAQRAIAACWGYSPLDQIDRDNVHQLRMVWSRGLAPGRQEGTPLAYDGVLYMPQANDVHRAGPGAAPQPREQPLRVLVALTRDYHLRRFSIVQYCVVND